MAEIIGYEKKIVKKYKGVCPTCGAIVIFDENEIHDKYQYNEYVYSIGTCPGCGYDSVSLDKYKAKYEETKEFFGWPNITNCMRNCKKCMSKCLYRKEQYEEV